MLFIFSVGALIWIINMTNRKIKIGAHIMDLTKKKVIITVVLLFSALSTAFFAIIMTTRTQIIENIPGIYLSEISSLPYYYQRVVSIYPDSDNTFCIKIYVATEKGTSQELIYPNTKLQITLPNIIEYKFQHNHDLSYHLTSDQADLFVTSTAVIPNVTRLTLWNDNIDNTLLSQLRHNAYYSHNYKKQPPDNKTFDNWKELINQSLQEHVQKQEEGIRQVIAELKNPSRTYTDFDVKHPNRFR